jgi:hypothetical protein
VLTRISSIYYHSIFDLGLLEDKWEILDLFHHTNSYNYD